MPFVNANDAVKLANSNKDTRARIEMAIVNVFNKELN